MTTELQTQGFSTRPLYRKIIRDGVDGNYDVLYQMIRLIRNSVRYDKGVEVLIKQWLREHGITGESSAVDQLKAVFGFVTDKREDDLPRIVYLQDIAGRVESLKSARQTLVDGFGDCDDQTVLNATLLGDLGFEDVRVAMAKYDTASPVFGHVYCVVYVQGKRIAFDTTLPSAELGKEVKAKQIVELPVFQDVQGLDGFSGIYNNFRYGTKELGRKAVHLVPALGHAVPLGFVGSRAFDFGFNLLTRAAIGGDVALSLPATASAINERLDSIILDLMNSRIAFDIAKPKAMQLAAQLAAIETKPSEAYALKIVGASIRRKLKFIENFPVYAREHKIRVVYTNAKLMLVTGVVVAGGVSYVAYKKIKGRKVF